MSALPERLGRGVALTAHWLNRLLDWCRSQELRAGPGIKLTRTPSGTTINLSAGPSAGPRAPADACPAVVRQSSGVPGVYDVWLYPAGIGKPGRSAATVSVTEFGVENDLPSGTIVLAHAIAIVAAEDGDDGYEEE